MLAEPDDLAARGAMLLGAHEAGIAIEQSMLGATHACANPLTARYGTTHGVAIAVMLPHVVRWNAARWVNAYAELLRIAGRTPGDDAGDAAGGAARGAGARRAAAAHAARARRAAGRAAATLAADAAKQWTGTFNPRPFDAAAALAAVPGGVLNLRAANPTRHAVADDSTSVCRFSSTLASGGLPMSAARFESAWCMALLAAGAR